MAFTRCILRWGLISGLALGAAAIILPNHMVASGLAHVRSKAQTVVDTCTEHPEALRRQLAELADAYPDRIAEVRGEIAEIDHQLAQFNRDIEVSTRVVAMTTEDLGEMKTLVARAEAKANQSVRPVAIRYQGARFDIDEAYVEARRINHVRHTYRDRLAHDEQQLKFLNEQKGRLTEILGKLEDEFSTYQAQLWQLDRQIDSIQRNERLIELTEAQQATLQSYDKFGKIDNLKQLEAKLAELRTVQEAQLQTLSKRGMAKDYEAQAERHFDTGSFDEDPFADLYEEVNLDNIDEPTEEIVEDAGSVALNN